MRNTLISEQQGQTSPTSSRRPANMKLGPQQRLMAELAMKMTIIQRQQMVEKSADLYQWEKDGISSPIDLLVKLKRKHSSFSEYVKALLKLVENVTDAQQLSDTVKPHLGTDHESYWDSGEWNGHVVSTRTHGKSVMQDFNNALLKMSQKLRRKDFEIAKAISPLPDGRKEPIDNGQKLFHALKEAGRISPDDTELLYDIFTLLELVEPLKVLQEYQEKIPRDEQPSAPPAHPSPYLSQHSYPPHAHPAGGYSSQGSLPTGWPTHLSTCAVQETTQPLHSRSPGYRDDTYPRPQHPSNTQHYQHSPSSNPSAYQQPPQQVVYQQPPQQVGGGGTNVSQTQEDSQQPFRTMYSSPQFLPPNPAHRPFQTQISRNFSLQQQSAASSANFHPSLSQQPASNFSQATLTGSLHPPPADATPLVPPVTSTADPTPSAPPQHHTGHAHSTPPELLTDPAPFAPPESLTNPTFGEAMSALSTGNRCSFPPPVHPPPADIVRLPPSQTPPNSSSRNSTSALSLPAIPAGDDRLLARYSRSIRDLHCSQVSRQPRPGAPPQPSPQRSVFSQGDIRAGVGGSDPNLLSINQAVQSQQEINAENNRSDPHSSPVHTTSPPRPPDGSSHLPPTSHLNGPPHHCYPPAPTPPRWTQPSLLVSGLSPSTPPGSGSVSLHSDPNQSRPEPSNPPNTLNSQFVSSYDRPFLNCSLSPASSASGAVLVSSHDPSTPSLVDRQQLRQAAHPSTSLSAISEVSSGGEGRSSESESSSEASLGKKRVRGEENSGSSSSSSEEEEEKSTPKRPRTEKSSKGLISSILSKINPWGKKQPQNGSDSEYESAQES